MVCWNGLVTSGQKDFKKQRVNNCWVLKNIYLAKFTEEINHKDNKPQTLTSWE